MAEVVYAGRTGIGHPVRRRAAAWQLGRKTERSSHRVTAALRVSGASLACFACFGPLRGVGVARRGRHRVRAARPRAQPERRVRGEAPPRRGGVGRGRGARLPRQRRAGWQAPRLRGRRAAARHRPRPPRLAPREREGPGAVAVSCIIKVNLKLHYY